MSCYEWESGSISIPRAEWASLKTKVRDAHNLEQKRLLGLASRLHDEMIAKAAGQRNVDWRKISQEAVRSLSCHEEMVWLIIDRIFAPNREKARAATGNNYADPISLKGSAGRPPKPTKGMFPEATNKTMHFEVTDGSISFEDKTRTVLWQVHENNHAIEHARDHPTSRALFAALDRIAWDTKSGGEIVGNNEYNRDNREAGGGGNIVNARYGRAKRDWEKSIGIKPKTPASTGTRNMINNFYGSPLNRRY